MSDPREDFINAAINEMLADANYDPHFAPLAERNAMDTKLFLRRYDAVKVWELEQTVAARTTAVYARPECIFNYCPSVGLCKRDDRCRSPFSGRQGA